MATTPEGKVKDKARALYKQHRAVYDRATATGMGRNGRPDDVVWRFGDGHGAGVEMKKEKVFKVSALQRVYLQKLEAAGASSMVVNMTNLEMLDLWLRNPGWRLNAQFEGDLCVGHKASRIE